MDALYFRVSTDRQTTENQFEDLLQVAERDGSGRDWTQIRDLLSRSIVEEEVGPPGSTRTVYRVNPSLNLVKGNTIVASIVEFGEGHF